MIALYQVWLPRIIARRLAAEHLADPLAARRHGRERRWRQVGMAIGLACGLCGVLSGMYAERLPAILERLFGGSLAT
jgi:hypothetical protein